MEVKAAYAAGEDAGGNQQARADGVYSLAPCIVRNRCGSGRGPVCNPRGLAMVHPPNDAGMLPGADGGILSRSLTKAGISKGWFAGCGAPSYPSRMFVGRDPRHL